MSKLKRKLVVQQFEESSSEEEHPDSDIDDTTVDIDDDDEPFVGQGKLDGFSIDELPEASILTHSKQSKTSTATVIRQPPPTKFHNKQRTLTLTSRGVSHRDRHLVGDLRDLMPHSKKDVKFDSKDKLMMINEVAEMKNCNNVIFFEARKQKDLYLWLAKCPNGPSIKFLVQNIHTMNELKMTGNSLRGARPILNFDPAFDSQPHWKLLKEMIIQIFGSPRGHPKTKPFIDHVFSWFIVDNRIFFRNYQVVYDDVVKEKTAADPVLVEIGPRMVLNPIRIFSGSFAGATLFENSDYVSPNVVRSNVKKAKQSKYSAHFDAKAQHKVKVGDSVIPKNAIDAAFEEFSDENMNT